MKKIRFDIIKNRKIYYIVSLVIILAGVIGFVVNGGFNLDIDFTGGTTMSIEMGEGLDRAKLDRVETVAEQVLGEKPSVVQKAGDSESLLVIKTKELDTEQRDTLFQAIKEDFSLAVEAPESTENVSATVGEDIRNRAVLSVSVAAVLMLIYITIRFELTSGLAAVTCLIHDLLIMLSVYVWFQIPLDTGFIAAALTILGYSINASIIVFDRIRENLRVARKEPFEEVAERSVWQTMGRTINTTLTTLFTVGMIFVLGVPSLKQFTLPLIVGIVAGAWSSIMLSASFWSFYRKHFRKKRI